MKIRINEHVREVAVKSTVGSVMSDAGIAAKGVAVALNGKLVPAEKWNDTLLCENDSLVIIKAFYGG